MNAILERFDAEKKAAVHHLRLQNQGFHPKISKGWSFWNPNERPSVKLKVPEQEFPEAKQFLKKSDISSNTTRTAVECPACGSVRMIYPQYKIKFYTPTLVAFLCSFFKPHKCYCQDCHHLWIP